jgi:hypothetical protein
MTLKTLADVRKLLSHIPKERRGLSTWQHVEKTLHETPRLGDLGGDLATLTLTSLSEIGVQCRRCGAASQGER